MWRVFFDVPERRQRAVEWVRDLGDPRVTSTALDVEDEDWARRSQADLRPVRVGRIVVAPPWAAEQARGEAGPDAILIIVVPSTGFGTGHHASTRLCLALLQEIRLRDRTVLDVGTGSGVLAIAAARLGARSVVAIDNDPDAVEAVRENLALNSIPASLRVECADFRTVTGAPADIIVANLTGELIRRSASQLVGGLGRTGDLLLSGVLAEEQAAVVAAVEAAGARLQVAKAEDDWVGLHFALDQAAGGR